MIYIYIYISYISRLNIPMEISTTFRRFRGHRRGRGVPDAAGERRPHSRADEGAKRNGWANGGR